MAALWVQRLSVNAVRMVASRMVACRKGRGALGFLPTRDVAQSEGEHLSFSIAKITQVGSLFLMRLRTVLRSFFRGRLEPLQTTAVAGVRLVVSGSIPTQKSAQGIFHSSYRKHVTSF